MMASVGCRASAKPLRASDTGEVRSVAGMYWGRWGEVPEGVRVRVWMHGDTRRLRGTWELPPWHGEFSGVAAEGDPRVMVVEWREEGVVSVLSARARRVEFRIDPRTGVLRGAGDDAEVIELVPAGQPDARLRPGVWLGRWTGLPPGMAVETVISRVGEGRWRASYRYQEREGMFEGETDAAGVLSIQWREVSTRGGVAHGRGVLLPVTDGLQGTYGVNEESRGTGLWLLEPL